MKSILQIGPVSYVGGASVHIKRLTSLLDANFNFNYIDESPKSLSKKGVLNIRDFRHHFKILKAIKNANLVHIHSGNWLFRIYFMLIVTILRQKFIVTLHSFRLKGFKLLITNFFLAKACRVIAVSKEIKQKLPQKVALKTIILEAFLPPIVNDEPLLPDVIVKLVKQYSSGNCLIAANAFRIRKLNDGELYGLDQCIKVAEIAKGENYKLHIIFVIGTVKDEDKLYLNTFLEEIEKKELSSYITIYPSSLSFVRLINKVDIVLRSTLTDGDALTIREAIYLNKLILASDVVKRPKGTVLYKTGNTNDLYLKIKELRKCEFHSDLTKFTPSEKEYLKEYLILYNQCNNSHKN